MFLCATHIIELEIGLYSLEPKWKKLVVYDFVKYIRKDWMNGAEVVACDMDSNFEESYEGKCLLIQILFSYFHIVKNLNDKVVSDILKNDHCYLNSEENIEASRTLNKTKYILTFNWSTLLLKN